MPFFMLFISRFGDMNDGAADSMLYYTGQAPLYFNRFAFALILARRIAVVAELRSLFQLHI